MSRSANDRSLPRTMAEPRRWLIIIAYDIPNDRRRTRIANTILGYGGRIQGSVYEVWITEQQYERLWAAIHRLTKDGDRVRAYQLCTACVPRIRSLGMEEPAWNPAIVV